MVYNREVSIQIPRGMQERVFLMTQGDPVCIRTVIGLQEVS